MRIIGNTNDFDLIRCNDQAYVPGLIFTQLCAQCNELMHINLETTAIERPQVNGINDILFTCGCGHVTGRKFMLRVIIEEVEASPVATRIEPATPNQIAAIQALGRAMMVQAERLLDRAAQEAGVRVVANSELRKTEGDDQ